MSKKYLNTDGLLYLWAQLKSIFVAKEDGKGLSSNDYTTEEKQKLAQLRNTEVVNVLTSDSTTAALSAAQGKALKQQVDSINLNLEDLGAGDMLKSVYDTNNSGSVDDAEKLGGQLPSYYAKASDIPTDNSQLANGAGYQTAEQVQIAVANAGHLKRSVVDVLPTVSEANTHTIYMVPISGATGQNKYTEWMVIDNAWEKTGDSDVDLTGYIQDKDLAAITNAEIDAVLAS